MDDAEKPAAAGAADLPTQEASISNWPSALHPTIESLLLSPPEFGQGSNQYQDLFLLRAPSSNVAETIRDILKGFRSDDRDLPGRFAFYNVSPADFNEFSQEEPRVRKCNLTYLASELGGLLSFKMPSVKHKSPADVMLADLLEQAQSMYCDEMIMRIGNAELELKDGISIKEPDEGIISLCRLEDPRKPTLVVEVGNSQSEPSLIRDKDIHFQMNDWTILVILIKLYTDRHRKMEIELWRRGDVTPSGAVTICLAEPLSEKTKMHCRTTWNVTGAPMHVSFEDVMACGKDKYDSDFTFSEDCFIQMACLALLVCPKTPRRVARQYSEYLSKSRAQKIELEEKEARQKEQDARLMDEVRQENEALREQVRQQDEVLRLLGDKREALREQIRQLLLQRGQR